MPAFAKEYQYNEYYRQQAQNAYDKDVRQYRSRLAEMQARSDAQVNQLNLQIKQLPDTLAQLTSQYNESLGLLNRLQETQNAAFDPQRKQMALQQALDNRQFRKEVGKVEAAFGSRGLAYSATAMNDMKRQSSILDEINKTQMQLLDLQQAETGVKQEQARTELRQQIDNSRLSISQKLEAVNQEVLDQKKIAAATQDSARPDKQDYQYEAIIPAYFGGGEVQGWTATAAYSTLRSL